MTSAKQSIFRAKAVEKYWQKQETAVLPTYLAPRFLGLLWLGVAVLLVAGSLSWMIKIPVLATGSAMVTSLPNSAEAGVVVLVPAQFASQVAAGQPLTIRHVDNWTQSVADIQPVVLSPAQIEEQFGLASGVVNQPMVVITAPLTNEAGDTAVLQPNVIYQADIKIGARSVLSLFPFIGPFFAEDV